ncbi:Imm50 family immunity protein [Streptomyces sp. NPDC002394]
MDASEWTAIVGSTDEIKDLYATPPNLGSECDLFYAHIDERGASVTLGFETSVAPSNPPAAWTGEKYNTLEFYLRFTGVKGLRSIGWDSGVRHAEITLSRCEGEGVRVSVEGVRSYLDFTASHSHLARTRPYLSKNSQ